MYNVGTFFYEILSHSSRFFHPTSNIDFFSVYSSELYHKDEISEKNTPSFMPSRSDQKA